MLFLFLSVALVLWCCSCRCCLLSGSISSCFCCGSSLFPLSRSSSAFAAFAVSFFFSLAFFCSLLVHYYIYSPPPKVYSSIPTLAFASCLMPLMPSSLMFALLLIVPCSRVRTARRRPVPPTNVFMGGVPVDCELTVLQAQFPGIVKGSVRNQVAFVVFDAAENADSAIARSGEAVCDGLITRKG